MTKTQPRSYYGLKHNHKNGYFTSKEKEEAKDVNLARVDREANRVGLARLAPLALAGELTEQDIHKFTIPFGTDWLAEVDHIRKHQDPMIRSHHHEDFVSMYSLRRWWCRRVAWAAFTVEYQEALLRLLQGLKIDGVFEVAAGRAVMQDWFQQRGVEWMSSDIEPPDEGPVVLDACEAARVLLDGQAIFASWIPHGSGLDRELAMSGRPMILVGEGWGGCTGSEAFWEDRDGYEIYDLRDIAGFRDVPRWHGISDHTVLVLPDGMSPPEGARAEAPCGWDREEEDAG